MTRAWLMAIGIAVASSCLIFAIATLLDVPAELRGGAAALPLMAVKDLVKSIESKVARDRLGRQQVLMQVDEYVKPDTILVLYAFLFFLVVLESCLAR